MAFIEIEGVSKVYTTAAGAVYALRHVDLAIDHGEFVAVVGKSGSGKSTLLNVLAGIDHPTSGSVRVGETPVHTLSENQLAAWRGRNVGIVFQFFQLMPTLTAIENVMLPMDFAGGMRSTARADTARRLLDQVDLGQHAFKLPAELSGGEQQRVAIARALANDPGLIVADEPTGNLDSRTAEAVFSLFARLVERGKTIVFVTHDQDLADRVDRIVTLSDGSVVADTLSPTSRRAAGPPPDAAAAERLAAGA